MDPIDFATVHNIIHQDDTLTKEVPDFKRSDLKTDWPVFVFIAIVILGTPVVYFLLNWFLLP